MVYENKEKTFIMLKPNYLGDDIRTDILIRLENDGLVRQASYIANIDEEMAREHYKEPFKTLDEEIQNRIVSYLTSGYLMPMLFYGKNAVEKARKLAGRRSDPYKCAEGTIRRDFIDDFLTPEELADPTKRSLKNIIHTSDSKESAEKEIDLWFHKFTKKILGFGMLK